MSKPKSAPSTTSVDDILNAEANAFATIELRAEFKNSTSGTGIKPELTKVVEFGDHELVLEVPSRSGAKGHMLVGVVYVIPVKGAPIKFECTGQITSIETSDSGFDRVVFQLTQYEEAVWNAMIELYSSRQAEILEFFAAARGY